MNSAMCRLPKTLKSLCETGCIYRDITLRHVACATVSKTDCAAPCYPDPCACFPASKMYKGLPNYKYYHEVQQLQEETERGHVRMRM
jgi:hypothetical protein